MSLDQFKNNRITSYREINNVLRENCQKTYYLKQDDFKYGSYIINKPGTYILKEDIIFSPNENNDFQPAKDSIYTKMSGFILNFFAAIVINSDNVIIDGQNHEIKMSKKFHLSQRFYAHIELNPAPFVMDQGPAHFGKHIMYPKNIKIKNFKFGLSSHHAIHGNGNQNCIFKNLYAKDYEFIAYHLNFKDNIHLLNCLADHNLQHIEVNALWSAALFLQLWTSKLIEGGLRSFKPTTQLKTSYQKLTNLIDITKQELFTTGVIKNEVAKRLFENLTKLPDGNSFGFVCHPTGVAINEFDHGLTAAQKCTNLYIYNCKAKNIVCDVDEVIGLSLADGTATQVDVAGSVFKIELATASDGTYLANPVADMQLALAALPTKVSRDNISQELINWSQIAGATLKDYVLSKKNYKYVCAQDSMGHLNKGLIGFRIEGVSNVLLEHIEVENLQNYGRLGDSTYCGNYEIGCSQQIKVGYRGADVIGIHLSCVDQVVINKFVIKDLWSHNGQASGIKLINDSKVKLYNGKIKNLKAGYIFDDGVWYGIDHHHNQVTYDCNLPNRCPNSVGINIKDKDCSCKHYDVCISTGNNSPISTNIIKINLP